MKLLNNLNLENVEVITPKSKLNLRPQFWSQDFVITTIYTHLWKGRITITAARTNAAARQVDKIKK